MVPRKAEQASATDEHTPLLAETAPKSPAHANGGVDDVSGSSLANKSTQNLSSGQAHSSKNQINDDGDEDDHNKDDNTPLPKLQIFLLCNCALLEPIAYFCIFPFVNQMIKETGEIPEEDVGFWSGIIESLFSLTQMLLMIFYGRAADRLGRKPVLVFSLSGITIATALFGMSKTLWQMILFRCLAGVFAGSSVTVRAMITENCTAKTQARAFSLYAFTRNLGILLGPLIGGALAKPAEQYPSAFGGSDFLKDYPYALPTFVTGAITAITTLSTALFLKETLNRKCDETSAASKPMTTWEILKAPGVGMVLYIFTHTMLLGVAFTAIMPVFLFTKPGLGGFGLSPQLISAFLAVAGASQALWILLVFPPLQHWSSTGAILRACPAAWVVFFALYPIGNELLRRNVPWIPFFVISLILSGLGSGVSMAFTCVQLALNDIAPNPATLGTVNALALTLNSGIRAVGPALFSALFATGVRYHILHGHLVWLALIALAAGLGVAAKWLPAKAEGKVKKDEDGV